MLCETTTAAEQLEDFILVFFHGEERVHLCNIWLELALMMLCGSLLMALAWAVVWLELLLVGSVVDWAAPSNSQWQLPVESKSREKL